MKAVVCELCGSNELVKQDGLFVCQHCSTKYTPEEAKKLFVTVKIDQTEQIENLYVLARRAIENEEYSQAGKYYHDILLQRPNDWEAFFYQTFCSAIQFTHSSIPEDASMLERKIDDVLTMIKQQLPEGLEREQAVLEVAKRCSDAARRYRNSALHFYESKPKETKPQYLQAMVTRCADARDIVYTLGNQINNFFPNSPRLRIAAVTAWKTGIYYHADILPYLDEGEANKEIILSYVARVKLYDPQYSAPNLYTKHCYIATCVYGSYDCPQVWTLRRWRDQVLARTWYGRAFIRTYYRLSPGLVRRFGQTRVFRAFWKAVLDRLVQHKNRQGISDQPYRDS